MSTIAVTNSIMVVDMFEGLSRSIFFNQFNECDSQINVIQVEDSNIRIYLGSALKQTLFIFGFT